MSEEALKILKKKKKQKRIIFASQIAIVVIFLLAWEVLASKKILNPFISAAPSE